MYGRGQGSQGVVTIFGGGESTSACFVGGSTVTRAIFDAGMRPRRKRYSSTFSDGRETIGECFIACRRECKFKRVLPNCITFDAEKPPRRRCMRPTRRSKKLHPDVSYTGCSSWAMAIDQRHRCSATRRILSSGNATAHLRWSRSRATDYISASHLFGPMTTDCTASRFYHDH